MTNASAPIRHLIPVFLTVILPSDFGRALCYVTNSVKHFKWKARGKRRIHDKPNWSEVAACRPWLDGELAAVHPNVLVPLDSTAQVSNTPTSKSVVVRLEPVAETGAEFGTDAAATAVG